MKTSVIPALILLFSARLPAHDLTAEGVPHQHDIGTQTPPATTPAPSQAAAFAMFAPAVKTRWDERFLYIESNGLPAHNMMVGITAWQQQVPLPQDYTGANAWRIPLVPQPAKEPATIRDRFLRGAIAIAANGIPIFNPQNNRGEISLDIGELDEWGGHCGRADDYHYHVAPLHLQKVTGPGHPVAYALDGYPVYGLTEPDGTEPKGLDALNGHITPSLGYHYHASKTYPFVMGGFHGEVTEREGQVDPQPRATPVRPALQALRGAKITGFDRDGDSAFKLTYTVAGETRSVGYAVGPDGTCRFEFDQGKDGKLTEVHTRREGRGNAGAPPPDREPRRDGRRDQPAPAARPDQPRSSDGTFLLSSPVVEDNGELPKPFTGEGEGISPPLSWKGAPAGTRCYALLMDHLDPKGEMKWYWTLYDMPGDVSSLKPGSREVGKLGTGFRGKLGYEPPMSKGPGPKTYVITLYALSAPLSPGTPETVNRESLLKAIQGKVLASSSLRVVHTSQGEGEKPPGKRPRPDKGNAKAGPAGLIKPTIGDTMKLNVYADNWFMLYVNDRLVAVDPIEFTPHNVVSVDFLPEYPMNIAVLVKDNADPKNGLEYGSSIGDGGFILKFGDGTVTNATWKAKCFFHGPIDSDTANPRVKTEPLPEKWWSAGFDDSTWPRAKEYTEAEVDPKQPYFESDFKDARFVWTADLALDNTVVFRTRIEKPGWTPRWNTKPDLDVRGPDPGAMGR